MRTNTAQQGIITPTGGFTATITAAAVWMMVVAAGCIWLSFQIFSLSDFGGLGGPVQAFVGIAALAPAALGIYGAVMLWMKRPAGRYAAMALLYAGFVLSIVALITVWRIWDSFEYIVDGVMIQPWTLLGFAVAYVVNWLSFRLDETNRLHALLQNIAMGLASVTLIVLLWFSGLIDGILFALGTYSSFPDGLQFSSPGVQAWVVTLCIIIFGWLAYRILGFGDYFNETPFNREAWQGWLMLSPNILGFIIFFAGPLLLSFYLSFTNDTIGNVPEVTWFENYAELVALEFKSLGDAEYPQDVLSFGYTELFTANGLVIGARDALFWRSMGNTFLFCLMLVPLATIPAIGMALILNSQLPGMKFFRAVYFLPSVAAVVGTALIWRWLYDPTIGFINHALASVGLIDGPRAILWLSDPSIVLVSIVLLSAWQVVGFNTVLFLAGLKGIPGVLYEASMIDGANGWQRFRFVTLPLLGPTTFFVIITTVITGLQVFNEPYTLFPARPIPTNATTSVYYMYTQGFLESQFGYASAVAWVLFGVIFVITLAQFRIQRSEAY